MVPMVANPVFLIPSKHWLVEVMAFSSSVIPSIPKTCLVLGSLAVLALCSGAAHFCSGSSGHQLWHGSCYPSNTS